MAVMTWSPELRIEVKKQKSFSSVASGSHVNCTTLSANEQKALDSIFLAKTEESKEPKNDFWM